MSGRGFIKGRGVVLAVMDTRFMMASMGSVVGEKITRAIELATASRAVQAQAQARSGSRRRTHARSRTIPRADGENLRRAGTTR